MNDSQPPLEPIGTDADDTSTEGAPRRAIRSFVVRAGRMGTGQIRALEELGPRFCLPYRAEPLDAAAVWGRSAPLVLEIGFGMGGPPRRSPRTVLTPTFSASRCTRPAWARCSS